MREKEREKAIEWRTEEKRLAKSEFLPLFHIFVCVSARVGVLMVVIMLQWWWWWWWWFYLSRLLESMALNERMYELANKQQESLKE